jgi:two-component system invasion response regulator UvrY
MIRILLVDDHRLFRLGVRKMLQDANNMEIVGEADCGEAAVAACLEHRPNVVLMDISMPGIGGLEATRRITRRDGAPRVVVLSAHEENPFPVHALKAGASGYLSKGVAADELVTAIKKVFLGKRYLSADVAQQLAVTAFEGETEGPFEQLSSREMQIMLMVVNCHKVNQISGHLHLSPKTVNSYRYRIFEKLNVKSDVELALMAVRYGVISGNYLEVTPVAALA